MINEDHVLRKTLKLVRLFEGFSEQDVRDFVAWATRFDARPGEAIIREGEHGHDLYVVAAGNLRVVKSSAGGELELAVLEPGDTFGEIAILDSGPRSASVVAITASTLLRFERKHLVKIPAVSLKLYRSIATMVAVRLRDTSARVILAKSAPLGNCPEDSGPAATRPRRVNRTG